MKKHAVTHVNDDSNLQVINPAHLGENVPGLWEHSRTNIYLVLKCSISIAHSCIQTLISLLLVQIIGLKKNSLELETNPTEPDCHCSACVHHPRRNLISEICSCVNGVARGWHPPGEKKRLSFPLIVYEILKKWHQHLHQGSTLTASRWICAFFTH